MRRAALPSQSPRHRLPDPAHPPQRRTRRPVPGLRAGLRRHSGTEQAGMTADPGSFLPVALRAADVASELIRTRPPASVTEKSDRDLVSDVDLKIGRAVRGYLHEATPDIGFLGEKERPSGDT